MATVVKTDGSVKYGSRVLEISGVSYASDAFSVVLEPKSCPQGMTGFAVLQYQSDRPHVGDSFETQIESSPVKFKITSVELIEKLDCYYTLRCSFAQSEIPPA